MRADDPRENGGERRERSWLTRLLDAFLPGRDTAASRDEEELRAEFQERYADFNGLLEANSRALAAMLALQRLGQDGRPFGLPTVRQTSETLLAEVGEVVARLLGLSENKYAALGPVYAALAAQVRAAAQSTDTVTGTELPTSPSLPIESDTSMPLALPLTELDSTKEGLAGSKMAMLGELGARLGYKTPPGFVATRAAYDLFMAEPELAAEVARFTEQLDELSGAALSGACRRVQARILETETPPELARAIETGYDSLAQTLGYEPRVAVRSSAVGEDMPGRSFAGQFRSLLNVARPRLVQAYKEVLASRYADHAVVYRHRRGISEAELPMAVGFLVMAEAVCGGVMYSVNPFDATDDAVRISASPGLPKSVVDGAARTDEYVVARGAAKRVLSSRIAEKSWIYAPADLEEGEGVRRVELSAEQGAQGSLQPGQAIRLAHLAVGLEELCGGPVDVEWVIEPSGAIKLLQCRPLNVRQQVPEEAACAPTAPASLPLPEVPPVLTGAEIASQGVASGVCRVVRRGKDGLLFLPGEVLVVEQALPRWAGLLHQASALVAEEGGVAGHLASVARELGVPALLGARGALGVLATGDLVTVAALPGGQGGAPESGLGAVYPDRQEELLRAAPAKADPMAGSTVGKVLARVRALCLPLTLLDPDGPGFTPTACRSLHDVTRYCHEKAVRAMFRFGESHAFPERAAKQLVVSVPMQFWVLNLDDGFAPGVSGKRVRYREIHCPPMRALWHGMRAMAWEGPPALSTRGFFSVLAEAASNPGLDPALGSPYKSKNYFLITREYVSLQSRFGFHFTVAEAVVNARAETNYVSFRFRGGAASGERKELRCRMIGELLEEHGFRTELTGDTLQARLEQREEAECLRALAVLGHLIMHTRQLDMVMTDQGMAARFGGKLRRDVDQLVEGMGEEVWRDICLELCGPTGGAILPGEASPSP